MKKGSRETIKKSRAAARGRLRGWYTGGYRPGRKNSRAAAALTIFILLLCTAGAGGGVLLADHNSRAVGWGENRVELAFAPADDRLGVTVMGQEYSMTVDTRALTQTQTILYGIGQGVKIVRPAPLTFLDMLCHKAWTDVCGASSRLRGG